MTHLTYLLCCFLSYEKYNIQTLSVCIRKMLCIYTDTSSKITKAENLWYGFVVYVVVFVKFNRVLSGNGLSLVGLNSLETPIKVSRCPRHDGFYEEGLLLTVALLIASYDAEAPALIVGLLQDNVPAPVHVTEESFRVGANSSMTKRINNI